MRTLVHSVYKFGVSNLKQFLKDFPVGSVVKNLPAMWETWVQSLDWEDLLEKGKATHSSILGGGS